MKYKKPWLPYDVQLDLLVDRGLLIDNRAEARAFLEHVKYYRLSGYCLAFESARHSFIPGATFAQIRDAYEFDRVLRHLLTEALELVEVDLRTAIAHEFARVHGPFGHLDSRAFYFRFDHGKWLESIRENARRSRETFVRHFREMYDEFPDLPIWMTVELMSFGDLSLMFQGMTRQGQKPIARRYGRNASELVSWFHHLVYLRNLCAHHARVWDREFAVKPKVPAGRSWSPPLLPGGNRLAVSLYILSYVLRRIPAVRASASAWRDRVEKRLSAPPACAGAMERMGLVKNWKSNPLWQSPGGSRS